MKCLFFYFSMFSAFSSFGQQIVNMAMGTCDFNSDPEYLHVNRLISKDIKGDTLFLNLGIVRNCGFEPKIELQKSSDSIIILMNNVSNIFMACLCCFEIELKVVGIKDTSFHLFEKFRASHRDLNSDEKHDSYYEIKQLKNKYIFPSLSEIESSEALNKYHNDSLRIGNWHFYEIETNKLKMKANYVIDKSGNSKANWRVSYNNKGEIINICAINDEDSEGYSYSTCISKEQYLKLEIQSH